MRFIRQADVQIHLPPDWVEQATAANRFVRGEAYKAARTAHAQGSRGQSFKKAVCEAVHKAVTKSNAVWSNTKGALSLMSANKCWYCECKQDRSDLQVDHFRPKNRVTGEKTHSGYWWLAFEWTNFRLACTFCNCVREDSETDEVGGKGNKFPIFDDVPRMCRRGDPPDRPKLLDPCIRRDVEALKFKPNGLPEPASTDAGSEDFIRAEETINVFSLRHSRLKRAREALAIELEDDVAVANACYGRGDMQSFDTVADRIVSRIRPDAQFVTFARTIIASHRDIDWVDKLWNHL
jgi:uncharacterized protein (TIGR02646 family)